MQRNRIRVFQPPQARYRGVDDLWIISSLFNSYSDVKKRNFERFLSPIQENLNWMVVDCAFERQPHVLPPGPRVVYTRTSASLWQKERLLNLAISHLPAECKKVAWVDADILFENPDWAYDASELLDSYPVVQLFDWIVRLPQGHSTYRREGAARESFASVYRRCPEFCTAGEPGLHGGTGIGWAARRELLDLHKLYDSCIVGGGDHLMAHAFVGDFQSNCVIRMTDTGPYHSHAVHWGERVYASVRGNIAAVPGAAFHLWHGSLQTRSYNQRLLILHRAGFDPARDIRLSPAGCWEWSHSNRQLEQCVPAYMAGRSQEGLEVGSAEVGVGYPHAECHSNPGTGAQE